MTEITASTVYRRPDDQQGSDGIATFSTGDGRVIQAMGLVDQYGRHIGGDTRPVNVVLVSELLDPFGRQRVSSVETIFHGKLLYDKDPLFWSEAETNTSGNATSVHNSDHACVDMHVETNDQYIRQNRTWWDYQPGKGQLILLTGVMDTGGGGNGITARIGYFHGSDGLFFELSGTTLRLGIRKNGSTTYIDKANWNFQGVNDQLDGQGPSGYTFDPSKAHIFIIDFQWLGVGGVRFGVGSGNSVVYIHQQDHAGVVDNVYMSSPNLPCRYEVSTTDVTANMKQICSVVMSEGGLHNRGITHSADTDGTIADLDSPNIYAMLGLRLNANRLGANVKVTDGAILSASTDSGAWFWVVNPTIAGTFNYNLYEGSVELAVAADNTNIVTPDSWETRLHGHIVTGQSTTNNSGVDQALLLGSSVAGVATQYVLCYRPWGANAIAGAHCEWLEER